MRLLLNLLDISKSEEGRLVPTLVEVAADELIRHVFESLEVRAQAKNIVLQSALEVSTLRADPDLFRRVLENLLENALRHAPDRSVVRLSVTAGAKATEIRITDAGKGVPEPLREAIFDRFVQVENSDSSVSRSGRGLGLAFCRLAVEAHGGRIWVEDAQPGAVFCLSLPNVQ
jgi:signal transduction histidine kinase